jgi:hypothetical protein
VHAVWHGEPGVLRSIGEFRPGDRMEGLFAAVFGAAVAETPVIL